MLRSRHYAIDTTSRNWIDLYAARDESEEVRGQQFLRLAHLYGQPGDLITFDVSCAGVRQDLGEIEQGDENAQI